MLKNKYIRNGILIAVGSLFSVSFYAFIAVKKDIIPFNLERVARVTGKSISGETFPNPNRTDELYDVGGTDLGIAWKMGNGKTGFFFGDSYGKDFKVVNEGGPGKAGNWRSNVLGISSDKNLADGLTFDNMVSHQIVPSPHITDGTGSHTTIPTAAIHAAGSDYVHYMDVRKWGNAGSWTTNYSGMYKSLDNGQNWTKCNEIYFDALSNFSQVTYAKKDGYVYMIGTVPGRWGSAHLARFREQNILKQDTYEYWNNSRGWIRNEEKSADAIIDAPLGELSLAYNNKFKRWIITYLNEKKAEIVLRDAEKITGPWSSEKTLVKAAEYPGLYGAFMHPNNENSDEFYFLMSMWKPYNVFLMKAKLKFAD
nr:DUF4185 domain-containing protein [Pedobacter panaciterrae]